MCRSLSIRISGDVVESSPRSGASSKSRSNSNLRRLPTRRAISPRSDADCAARSSDPCAAATRKPIPSGDMPYGSACGRRSTRTGSRGFTLGPSAIATQDVKRLDIEYCRAVCSIRRSISVRSSPHARSSSRSSMASRAHRAGSPRALLLEARAARRVVPPTRRAPCCPERQVSRLQGGGGWLQAKAIRRGGPEGVVPNP